MKNHKDIVAQNIIRAIKERGILQEDFAKLAQLSKAGLINYKKGLRTPDIQTLSLIAGAAEKPIEWFFIDHEEHPEQTERLIEIKKSERFGSGDHYLSVGEKEIHYEIKKIHGIKEVEWIKLLGKVPAGFPDVSQSDFIDEVPMMKGQLPKNSFALKVKGDSMINEFLDGDLIFFCSDQLNPNPGQFVIAVDEFGGTMVKQFQLKKNEIWLVSLNPVYKPFKANEHYKILGTVVGKSSNFIKY